MLGKFSTTKSYPILCKKLICKKKIRCVKNQKEGSFTSMNYKILKYPKSLELLYFPDKYVLNSTFTSACFL